ncbi:hypothetical protein E0Z10_g518 [Xylaria hypoxylon]|uniref:Extracellular membrane protein CFEM domain-containing protein n=1 Tax=Xylaria hypoxylon TaxID=37992 RepID=A0A4Z0Z7I4_9PEZI|nr:hypothetical protein E0Z10_g518 [Xylaria hypoxylon]
MRFTPFIVAGVFAVAASAQTTTAAASTSVSIDPAQSTAVSEIQACLAECDPTDTKCRANCISVPSPDNASVNATTACVAACPQGSGTAADNLAYADCVQKCIGEFYYTTSGTPNLATSNAANGDNSASVTNVPTTIVTDGSTIVTSVPRTATQASDSPSTTSSSEGAAAVYGPVGTGLTLFGLLAGFIAL